MLASIRASIISLSKTIKFRIRFFFKSKKQSFFKSRRIPLTLGVLWGIVPKLPVVIVSNYKQSSLMEDVYLLRLAFLETVIPAKMQ